MFGRKNYFKKIPFPKIYCNDLNIVNARAVFFRAIACSIYLSLLHLRYLLDQLDEAVADFASAANAIHKRIEEIDQTK